MTDVARHSNRNGDATTATRRHRIAARIRRTRKAAGIQQCDLARAAGIDPATLNQIEQARRLPDLSTLLALAEQLDVPTSTLLDEHRNGSGPLEPLEIDRAEIVAAVNGAVDDAIQDVLTAVIEVLRRRRQQRADNGQ